MKAAFMPCGMLSINFAQIPPFFRSPFSPYIIAAESMRLEPPWELP